MNSFLTPEIAQTIMGFMDRVDLKGREVPVYATCMTALARIAQPPAPVANDVPVDADVQKEDVANEDGSEV